MTKRERLFERQIQSASALRLFGREWLRSPLRVGAISPSSAALAQAITTGLTDTNGPVIELGPGTGVFTDAILGRGLPPGEVAVIEASSGFAAALAIRHPYVNIIVGDAARIRHLTPFGPAGAEAIVCGLPLLSMPPAKVLRILSGGLAALRSGGTFRLFTYGLRCPVSETMRVRLGNVARRTAFVAANMPPASVFTLERRERL